MTPSELLAAFETLAEAPDGVARLRELVLSLAVRGKLVAQDPGEEPSRPLVLAARQHLAGNSDGIRRGSWNMTSEVGESEYPFDLPSGWAWARVNDTGFYINGLAFKPSHWKDAGRPIIRIQNLSDPSKPFNYAEGEFPDDVVVRRGDILVSWSATLEAFVWDREDGVLNQHIFRVKPAEVLVSRRFLYYLLRQAIRDMADSKHAHGLVMAHINRGPFLNHVVAIPPLAEQHRIVARVDELMGLLDRLEAVRNRRDEVRRAARDAALAALRAAPDAEAVEAAWTRISGEIHALFAHPEDVAPLRQAVLQLAVRGRLVKQDPGEEPASALLLSIHAEKLRLMRENVIRQRKPQPKVSQQDQPFECPNGWSWARLEDLVFTVGDGPHFSPRYTKAGVPFLSTRNMSPQGFRLGDMKYVSVEDHREFSKRIQAERGDILYTKGGTTGIALVNDLDFEFSVWVHIAVLKIDRDRLSPKYVATALSSPHCYEQSQAFTHGIGNRDLGLTRMVQITIPIPPLAEQHRIVAKVDALMAICDAVEARLTTARTLHSQAAAAAVHHLDV